jgi:hypothetical protein
MPADRHPLPGPGNGVKVIAAESCGSPIVNALTIDVEDYFHVAPLAPSIAPETWSEREYRVERHTKRLLEDTTGAAVLGYRAASFFITSKSLWVLDVLINAGFTYDSSIFPIRYGIPGAAAARGPILAPSGRAIVEFPMSAARFFGMRVPVSGGGYFRILPYWLTCAGLRQINTRAGIPFTFYLHPWETDPGQPRVKVKAFSRFRHYTNLGRCESRLRRLLDQFAFAPAVDVLRRCGAFDSLQAANSRVLPSVA